MIAVRRLARAEKAEPGTYGEKKKPKQFMITDSVSNQIEDVADELGITRSEVLERMVRCGGLEAAKRFDSATGTCRQA